MKYSYAKVVGKPCYICSKRFTRAQWNRPRSIRNFTGKTTLKFEQWKDYKKILNTNRNIPPLGKYYHYDCLTSQYLKEKRVSAKPFGQLSRSGQRGRILKLNDEIIAFCERMQYKHLICPLKLTEYIVKCLTIEKLSAVDSFALALYRVRNLTLLRKIVETYPCAFKLSTVKEVYAWQKDLKENCGVQLECLEYTFTYPSIEPTTICCSRIKLDKIELFFKNYIKQFVFFQILPLLRKNRPAGNYLSYCIFISNHFIYF